MNLDLKALAVILNEGADAAARLEDAPLHAALWAMAETAVTLAESENEKRWRYAEVRERYI